jgi:alpha-L-rhamnosidase
MKYIFLGIILLVGFSNTYGQDIKLTNLRCELLVNPEGIDALNPRLSWEIESKQRYVIQKNYQIMVSSSQEKLNKDEGDVWSSGTISSDQSVQISYSGKPLTSGY